MSSFLGVLQDGDKGLYVSTGGFTKQAMQKAKNHQKTVTLLDRDGFIKLLLEHYEKLSSEYKAKVTLRRVWIPVEE